jgi:hypothetical protein
MSKMLSRAGPRHTKRRKRMNESKEVAAAVLTRIVFDHNEKLQTEISGVVRESALAEVVKVYNDCLRLVSQA